MSQLRLLKLHAEPDAWRLYTARKADKAFRPYQERVLDRDHHTCQYCGFQARQYQEVVNVDHDYHHNAMNNLVTACCFCAQCHFLEMVGRGGEGGGTLIYMPDLDQAKLNGLCHVLFCAMANATSYRVDAQTIYRELKMSAQIIDDELGENMSDPAVFGQVVIDSHIPNSQMVGLKMLDNIRLLPSRESFQMQVETWASAALSDLSA